jgi:alginate O-acetyltransferase complex protein AlgI
MNWQEIIKLFAHDPKEPLLFHTGFFLLIFSVFLIVYAFVVQKNKLRNLAIIIFSLYFYYKASGIFVVLLLITLTADYIFSLLIHNQKSVLFKKVWLFIGIIFSLSFLIYFKYKNFFLQNLSLLTGDNFTTEALILPIGISFYTFQSISYLIDTYNNRLTKPSYSDYLMYMTFFPHLVAGPIVRAKDFLPQLEKNLSINKAGINEAFYLITKGLVKKVIIADFVAQYSDIVFSAPDGFSGTEHILSSLCYTLQIFCDFSGYTDMAIGIALLLGFRLCLNFDSPYKATSITNFWRRWHISLSTWLRDYIYIPLGGNKKGINLQLLFLLFTMLIGGFWHGADWKFIFWGGAHGVLLILHKLFTKYLSKFFNGKLFTCISWAITFCCVSLLWIPFRAQSIQETWLIYCKIFTDSNISIVGELIRVNYLLFVLVFCGYFFTLIPTEWKENVKKKYYNLDFYGKIILLALLIQVIIQVRSSSVQPFIYFQF